MLIQFNVGDFDPFTKETGSKFKTQVQVVSVVLSTTKNTQEEIRLSESLTVQIFQEVD